MRTISNLNRRSSLNTRLRHTLNYNNINQRMKNPRTNPRSSRTTFLRIPGHPPKRMKLNSLTRNSNNLCTNISTLLLRGILRNRTIRSHSRRTRMINSTAIRTTLKRLHTARMITTTSSSNGLHPYTRSNHSLPNRTIRSIQISARIPTPNRNLAKRLRRSPQPPKLKHLQPNIRNPLRQ